MIKLQKQGCQALVILSRVIRKENVRALLPLSTKSISEPRISSYVNKPFTHVNIREVSYSTHIVKDKLQLKRGSYVRRYSDDSEGKYPEHHVINFPALSPTMEMGSIVAWEKKEGDQVSEGDLLCEIETDKATMGFDAPEEGYLAKIILPAGSKDIPIGRLLCIITPNEEDVTKFSDYTDVEDATKKAEATEKKAPSLGFDEGINPNIQPLHQKSPAPATPFDEPSTTGGMPAKVESGYTDVEITNWRRVIAKRLRASKSEVPHYYLTVDVEMGAVMQLRAKLNSQYEKDGIKLSVNDFIIKATALTCRRVPAVNSAWMDTFIRENHSCDVSVAVDTGFGLITPIVTSVEAKGLAEISNTIKELARRAKEGKLQPHEFEGGSITVSNLGMYGISHFTAIINPPQSCILAVGEIKDRVVPTNEGTKTAKMMSVTLSCDHRVVDGAVGAQWLKQFKDFLEQPTPMLLQQD